MFCHQYIQLSIHFLNFEWTFFPVARYAQLTLNYVGITIQKNFAD